MFEVRIKTNFPPYADILARWVKMFAHKVRQRMRERLRGAKHGRVYPRKSGTGFSRFHRASAKGESPATDTGAYDRSLSIIMRNSMEASIQTNLGYPFILEEHMNRPLAKPSVEDMLPEGTADLQRMLNA